jgi:hydroxymethylpyrimidine pyrophosphatase-like HAD family hydrolase
VKRDWKEKLQTVRGISCDVDGTLRVTGTRDFPSPRIKEAYRTWKDVRGAEKFHDFIVSGSPWSATEYIVRFLDFRGPQVSSGGAEIFDAEKGRMIINYPINKGVARDLCRHLIEPVRAMKGKLWIQDNGLDYDPLDVEYRPQNPYVIVIDSIPAKYTDSLIKELRNNNDITAYKVILAPENEHLEGIHITHHKATKYHAIMEVSDMRGISPKQLLGIGDGPNDRPLLEACGVRVAIRKSDGNVAKELEGLYDYIAPSVEHDGVVDALKQLIGAFSDK